MKGFKIVHKSFTSAAVVVFFIALFNILSPVGSWISLLTAPIGALFCIVNYFGMRPMLHLRNGGYSYSRSLIAPQVTSFMLFLLRGILLRIASSPSHYSEYLLQPDDPFSALRHKWLIDNFEYIWWTTAIFLLVASLLGIITSHKLDQVNHAK